VLVKEKGLHFLANAALILLSCLKKVVIFLEDSKEKRNFAACDDNIA